jgi:transposase
MPHDETILGLSGYEIKEIRREEGAVLVLARYTGPAHCPHCGGDRLRNKDRYIRTVRHESWGMRRSYLQVHVHKFHCLTCGRYFNERLPGILPRRRSSEGFRRQVFWQHYDGICRKTLAERQHIGTATVERWFHDYLEREAAKMSAEPCPQVLGIDEHFFTRRLGYATTLCDLRNHKVYDVVLGRSESALDGYFSRLRGKENVQVVCIDLASSYRALIRKHFPHAKIVADRFHVIRLVNHDFLASWRELDPLGAANRGLLCLMRRHAERLSAEQQQRLKLYLDAHPAIAAIYAFKQRLAALLREKTCRVRKCRHLIPQLLSFIDQLKSCGFQHLQQLGRTLGSWSEEIAAMWRFTRNNAITEGFHNKMEMISRRAFGFRNFDNYRLRVRVMCA